MSENQQPYKTDNNAMMIALAVVGIIVLIGIGIVLFATQRGQEEELLDTTPVDDNIDGIREFDPPQPLTNFTFTSTSGEPVSLSDFAGRYVLIYFGYTNCPDFCPATLLDYEEIIERLGEDSQQVVFLFISVDPDRDTPDVLANYLSRYDPAIVALSGNVEELERIAPDFDLQYAVQPESAPGIYNVDHTVSKFLIDPNGQLIRVFSWGLSTITIAQQLRNLIQS